MFNNTPTNTELIILRSGRSASSGGPKLGFGSINDDGDAQRVTCDKSEMAPVRYSHESRFFVAD